MNPDSIAIKCLLFPLSLLFGLAVAFKNLLYLTGFFSGVRFSIPVIGVGNLTVGGAGKTPHVEYLVRLLKQHVRVAVMSRGYGRHTTGFMLVSPHLKSAEAGDESLIFARKYPDIAVAVAESRSAGIPMLLQQHPETQLIILDDAFQHRSVSPHLNILLTEYSAPFYSDWLMPSGSLREWRAGYHRADVIIVTKCPESLIAQERNSILQKINPGADQRVFFSTYKYHPPYSMFQSGLRISLSAEYSVLLVCGIAKTQYLEDSLIGMVGEFDVLRFEDHYEYDQEDIELIRSRFNNLKGSQRIILTTEKDAVRLEPFGRMIIDTNLPVFILPAEVVFLFDEGQTFDDMTQRFLLDFKV